jgi:DNA (cytosine-5)-methyltransferase 1
LRRLTVEEVRGLQGFPADWRFSGNRAQVFKQIGNAVPTVFGEILGGAIKRHLQNFPSTKAEKLEIPRSLTGYMEYTKKDHARNESARSVHLRFGARDQPSEG